MNLTFQENGNLPEGIHIMTIDEFEIKFGYTEHRKKLILGLKRGMKELKDCGCETIFIDGSFVSTKVTPNDFDACWNTKGVNLMKIMSLYPTMVDFDDDRKKQKQIYYGEFFPAEVPASRSPLVLFYNFFQKDRDGKPKGIVQINLK